MIPALFTRHLTDSPGIPSCTRRAAPFLAALLLLAPPAPAAALPEPSELKADTIEAFDRYIRLTDARNDAELQRSSNLLFIDALPESQRREAYTALLRGEVKMQKVETRDNGATIKFPGALLHHWAGAIFIPGASVDDVLRTLEDYDQHATYFAPDVERSKTLTHDGDHFRVFLRFRRHKVITAVLNTEHDVHYFRDSPARAHSRSSAVRIAEVENAGKPSERERTPGQDSGYLWRMETWWRIEQRDAGVYVQSEVVSLTRDIPAGLGWLIGPFVNGIPKETLTFTLESTRKAVRAKPPHS